VDPAVNAAAPGYDLRRTTTGQTEDPAADGRIYPRLVAVDLAEQLHRRSRLRAPPRVDVAIAVGLAAVGTAEMWLLPEADPVTGTVAVLALTAPLAWRRQAPLIAALAVFGALLVTVFAVVPLDRAVVFIPALVIALYSVAVYLPLRRAGVGLAFALATGVIGIFVNDGPGFTNLLFALVVVTGPWVAGRLVRLRTAQAVQLALRAQDRERSQAERERAAVAAERARIARELHDVIAHSVSVMTVQAGALESVLDQDVDKARTAAAAIRLAGRQAQVELRRLLGLLRDDEQDPGRLTPQPGLGDLEQLLATIRRAGVEVHLEIEGAVRRLPPGVDLSVFRVVQEALTNVLKHSQAATAQVGVRFEEDAVAIDVADDGVGDGDASPGGHGLAGMRERLALYGGRLEYGRRSGGGFEVRALLPIGDDA
jgi:signal transduction histidine kinase